MLNCFMANTLVFWAQIGISVEEIKEDGISVLISVPKKSFIYDKNGKEMSGWYLIEFFTAVYDALCDKTPFVAGRIRNEKWTSEKALYAGTQVCERLRRNGYRGDLHISQYWDVNSEIVED